MQSNPYVGPRSFATGERLYGRDRELRRLANLLIAERVVLLYSPSGAGKTSLVQAALVPRLRDEGFQVLPPARVGAEPPPGLPGVNRYVLSALMALDGHRPTEEQIPLAELAGLSIDEYLGRVADPQTDGTVLIFDQFEEVLSVVPNDRAAKEEFFAQVGAALRPRERWALFSMREDYIAPLDPFLRELPTRLSNRFRLDMLEAEAALAAAQAPARAAGVTFDNETAQRLIDDLRTVRVQRADGTTEAQLGLYVEPVQLQVVCYRIWAQMPEGDAAITQEDVERIGDVTSALRGYYAERVAAAAGARERAVRDWFDGQLITAQGIRGQVLREPGASGGLDNRVIAALLDSHLVRGEQIRGATWYELAHDRLIEPVLADNAAWREAHLSPLQRQAALWQAEDRPDGLLLRDGALSAAEVWAEANPDELGQAEHDFLERCRQVRQIIRRERRTNQIIRALAVVASIASVVAAMMAYNAILARQAAEARALAHAALSDGAARPQRSLLLALESQRLGADLGLVQGEEALQQLLTQAGGVPERLPLGAEQAALSADGAWVALYGKPDNREATPYQLMVLRSDGQGEPITLSLPRPGSLSNLALSRDGALLAATTASGDVLAWRVAQPQDAPALLREDMGSYTPISFSQDGALLAAGDASGQVFLWRSDSLAAEPLPPMCAQQPVTAVAISPDNQSLAIGYHRGHVWRVRRDAASEKCIDDLLHIHQDPVSAIAYSPQGDMLVSGSSDSEVLVGSTVDSRVQNAFHNHSGGITRLQFSADGKQIISSSRDGSAQIWGRLASDKSALVLRGHEGWVLSASFSQGDTEILTIGRDGTLRRWDALHPAATAVIHQHSREVAGVAFSPDQRWLAVTSIDRTTSLWAVAGGVISRTAVLNTSESSWWVSFSPDSRMLATASEDGKVRLWQVDAPKKPLATIEAHPGQIVTAVAFSPDGRRLASVGYDGALRLWDLSQAGQPTPVWEWASEQPLQTVAISDDGRYLAAAGDVGVVNVWAMDNLTAAPQELGAGMGYGAILGLAFRPHHPGQLAGAGFDAKIWLWDLGGSDRTPRSFSGHSDWIIGIAFSPDGGRMASASNDSTVRLWDPDQPQLTLPVLRGHSANVDAVAFSPDGRWLASASLDATAIVWPLDLATLREWACAAAGRELTKEEIEQVGGRVSNDICPELP